MPFCVSCGKENKESAKFCTACGKSMAQPSHKTEPAKGPLMPVQGNSKSGTNLTNKLLIGGIALLLAVLLFWLLNKYGNKGSSTEQTVTVPVTKDTQPPTTTTVQPDTKSVMVTTVKKDSPVQQQATNAPVDEIKEIIRQYFALIANNDCLSINAFYEPVLENYYNRRNLNRSEVLTDCITYQTRWPFHRATVDYNSLQVTNIANGGYLVTYQLSSAVKKKETDDWKPFNLFITIHFTEQLKIKSVYEIKQ